MVISVYVKNVRFDMDKDDMLSMLINVFWHADHEDMWNFVHNWNVTCLCNIKWLKTNVMCSVVHVAFVFRG